MEMPSAVEAMTGDLVLAAFETSVNFEERATGAFPREAIDDE